MELKDDGDNFVMPDHRIFDAIRSYLAEPGYPPVAHFGEPLACWQPIVGDMPHAQCYGENPQ